MKKITPIYLLLLLFILQLQVTITYAQEEKVDSLKKILPKTKDSTRVHLLNEIAYALYVENPEEAIEYAEQALELSTKMEFYKGIALSNDLLGRAYLKLYDLTATLEYYLESAKYYEKIDDREKLGEEYNEIGVVYKNKGEYNKALEYYFLALDLFEQTENKNGKGNALINIGQIYSYQANFEKSIEYYIKSIKISEEIGDKTGLAIAHGHLGNLYYNLKEYDKALEYFKVAEKLFRELEEKIMLTNVLNNIGLIYSKFENNSMALEYYQSALELSQELGYKNGMAFGLSNIGALHHDEEKYTEAIKNFEKALKLFRETGNKSLIAGRLINLGDALTKLERYEEAYTYLQEGLSIAKEIDNAERELFAYKALFEFHESTKDYNKSLEYYKKFSALKDSVFNIQKSEQIAEIQTRYETEKKEQENELLRKERAIREETITRKEAQNRMLLIGIVFILAFAGYFFIVYRQKQRTNLLLSRQNEEINLKQQEIISINASLQDSQKQLSLANEELQRLNSNLEHTVKERTYELQKSNIELDTFLYQSSHALRRPIVSIMGLVQIVRLETKPDQINVIRDKIEDTAKKMDVMLRKLVMASEINISQFDPLKPINFTEIIEETWSSLKSSLKADCFCFKTRIEPIESFYSKEVLIRILFHNILENAILYTADPYHHNSKIKVSVSKQQDTISIEIMDNGIGIAPELTERIFDMFTVANENPKGFGLGLYIVKKTVEKLNGKIKVHSRENSYTSFQVILPFIASPAKSLP